jgi:hypothetical protein
MTESMPNSNFLDASNYGQIEPSDVTNANQHYPTLIIRQLQQINYLLSMGTQRLASTTGIAQVLTIPELAKSVRRALRSIESMICPYLKEDYYKQATIIKQNIEELDPTRNDDQYFEQLAKWYDLLVKNLGAVDLLPQKSVDVDLTEDLDGVYQ